MKKIHLTVFAILAFFVTGWASNPVTMTSFYSVYNYLPEVNRVMEHGQLDGHVISWLVDDNNALDQKAAVINALTANNKMKTNALSFKQFVARKYGQNWESMDFSKVNAADLFCLGYITLLDEGGKSAEGEALLEQAMQKDPSSFTMNLFSSLAKAQSAIEAGKDCEAWKMVDGVRTNTALSNDLDNQISKTLFDSMETYNKGC